VLIQKAYVTGNVLSCDILENNMLIAELLILKIAEKEGDS